jgi:hypothetical protein
MMNYPRIVRRLRWSCDIRRSGFSIYFVPWYTPKPNSYWLLYLWSNELRLYPSRTTIVFGRSFLHSWAYFEQKFPNIQSNITVICVAYHLVSLTAILSNRRRDSERLRSNQFYKAHTWGNHGVFLFCQELFEVISWILLGPRWLTRLHSYRLEWCSWTDSRATYLHLIMRQLHIGS